MNNSTNCGSTAGGGSAETIGWVEICSSFGGSIATVTSGFNLTVLAMSSPLGTSKVGTRDGPCSANALMHISALSNMYQGSLRPFCRVSM